MHLVEMTDEFAADIATWRYPEPYGCYDMTGADPSYFTDLHNGFFALLAAERLIGYRSFGADGRVPGGEYDDSALDIGGGLRPELAGQGLGKQAITTGMEFGRDRFAPSAFRVTVADFNIRALKVVDVLGFERVDTFVGERDDKKYQILVLPEA